MATNAASPSVVAGDGDLVRSSLWVVIDERVYDVSAHFCVHPGEKVLTARAPSSCVLTCGLGPRTATLADF